MHFTRRSTQARIEQRHTKATTKQGERTLVATTDDYVLVRDDSTGAMAMIPYRDIKQIHEEVLV